MRHASPAGSGCQSTQDGKMSLERPISFDFFFFFFFFFTTFGLFRYGVLALLDLERNFMFIRKGGARRMIISHV